MRLVDRILNQLTMYRLVLYYLIALLGIAVMFSFTHGLAYDPFALLFSTAFILAVCTVTNSIFARVYGVAANVESTYISALILALVISPIHGFGDLWFLFWASVLAMASKYIINLHGKHLFNPVAFSITLTYFTINQSASWWIANPKMLPFVLVGGLLVARKLRRFQMVGSFMIASLVTTSLGAGFGRQVLGNALDTLLVFTPFFFFAFIMLTEPLTTPPTNTLRNLYAGLVGVLFAPAFHLGGFYTTPELALVMGNLFSYLVSPKNRLILSLKAKHQMAPNAYEFVFAPQRKLAYTPGQYMEWTLGHREPDSRGNRRYFTLASAPTEPLLRLGVRFNEPSSSYKQALLELDKDDEIIAGQLSGDFTLSKDPNQPLVFIAGGIGVTPYRSMIKYLLDLHQPRPITLFYGNRTVRDIVYKDIFDQAERELGIRTIYTVEETTGMAPGWVGIAGMITPKIIRAYARNYRQAVFFISGPIAMVDAVRGMLHEIKIPESRIKTDFFAGL